MTRRTFIWVMGGIAAAGLLAVFYGVSFMTAAPAYETQAPMHFDIATTTAVMERGLGGRASIPSDYGMLFVFKQDGRPGFWMKDMLVPIDIIWLSANGTVVSVDASVATSTYPDVFYPPHPVRYVLETRAGVASARGWSTGVHVPLPLPYGK